jgi:DNA modification methylase
MELNTVINSDALEGLRTLPDNSIDCCATSPPYYGLRDYGVAGQIGLEASPGIYIEKLVEVFMEVFRVLKPAGTLWLNIGDSYAGSGRGKGDINRKGIRQKASYVGDSFDKPCHIEGYKPKDLIGIPFMLAFALRARGWYLRQDIIWHKPNAMPESVKDRCVKAHEYIFLLSKNKNYYFDYRAIEEKAAYDGRHNLKRCGSGKYQTDSTGLQPQNINCKTTERWRTNAAGDFIRNRRDVWEVPTRPLREEHFAPFPQQLVKTCILAGCPENGVVLDPFMGSGTTAVAARKLNRNYTGFELNPKYVKIAERRLRKELGMFE